MRTFDEFVSGLVRTWGNKTLKDLRIDAEREATGVAFQSVRLPGGPRVVIIVCLADIDQIARAEQKFQLVESDREEDWTTLTLHDLAVRTSGVGITYESLRDEFGRRSALILTAAGPEPVAEVEAFFGFPD